MLYFSYILQKLQLCSTEFSISFLLFPNSNLKIEIQIVYGAQFLNLRNRWFTICEYLVSIAVYYTMLLQWACPILYSDIWHCGRRSARSWFLESKCGVPKIENFGQRTTRNKKTSESQSALVLNALRAVIVRYSILRI